MLSIVECVKFKIFKLYEFCLLHVLVLYLILHFWIKLLHRLLLIVYNHFPNTFSFSCILLLSPCTLADAVEKTAIEYSDRSLTVLWPVIEVSAVVHNWRNVSTLKVYYWWRRSANGEPLHCLQWQIHDVFLVFIAEK